MELAYAILGYNSQPQTCERNIDTVVLAAFFRQAQPVLQVEDLKEIMQAFLANSPAEGLSTSINQLLGGQHRVFIPWLVFAYRNEVFSAGIDAALRNRFLDLVSVRFSPQLTEHCLSLETQDRQGLCVVFGSLATRSSLLCSHLIQAIA